ncbi:MAG: carbon-nitrogen hydrolase [Gammaproteobacteria bacterium]|nr:carbon-nitrogen hydrolase [Gammaproteobacteria bacterium]
MNVVLVQQKMYADYQANLDYSIAKIQTAAKNGADLVVLCELHSSLYFCQEESFQYFNLAQTIPGPLTDKLAETAKDNNVVIVGSLFEKRADGLYHNTAVVFDKDGSLAGFYRKMHIPDDPGYYEKYYFALGDLGFTPIQTSIGKLGVMVCWDQWFPESARLMALAGAQVLIYPSAIGWDPRDDANEQQRQFQAWQIIQQSHAIANNLPLISANRVGLEKDTSNKTAGIDFWGQSFVADTMGKIIAQASSKNAETIQTQIDLTETEKTRQLWPYLRDRRIEAYNDLNKRYIDES